MGMIIASESYAECNVCRGKGPKHQDQVEAFKLAIKAGWFHSSLTGGMICLDCRRKQKQAWVEEGNKS